MKPVNVGGDVAVSKIFSGVVRRKVQQFVDQFDTLSNNGQYNFDVACEPSDPIISAVPDRKTIDDDVSRDNSVELLSCALCGTAAIMNISGLRQHFADDHNLPPGRIYQFLAEVMKHPTNEDKGVLAGDLILAQKFNALVSVRVRNNFRALRFQAADMENASSQSLHPLKRKQDAVRPKPQIASTMDLSPSKRGAAIMSAQQQETNGASVKRVKVITSEAAMSPIVSAAHGLPSGRFSRRAEAAPKCGCCPDQATWRRTHLGPKGKASPALDRVIPVSAESPNEEVSLPNFEQCKPGLKIHVGRLPNLEMALYTLNDVPLTCKLCRDTSVVQPYRHALMHSNLTPFECISCAYRTNTRELILEHLAGLHESCEGDQFRIKADVLTSDSFYDDVQRCFGKTVAANARVAMESNPVVHATTTNSLASTSVSPPISPSSLSRRQRKATYTDVTRPTQLPRRMIGSRAVCKLCEELVSQGDMEEHVWWHVGKKRLWCAQPSCGYTCVMLEQMVEHYEAVHDTTEGTLDMETSQDEFQDMFDEAQHMCFGDDQ